MTNKVYEVTMNQSQYDDWLEHLTYPPNIQDIKKPNKKEYNPPGQTNSHPTIKPVKLMEWFVTLLTNENDIVLDLFMGSGTTGVACNNLNRTFIGIEQSAEYCQLAKDRGVK